MNRSSPGSRNPYSRDFPDLPGASRARLLWGVGIGLVVGFVSAILRFETRTWSDVGLRMGASALVFGVLAWRLGDRFWRSPILWLVAMGAVGALLGFF
jgi:hypothetical protein